MKFKRLKNPDSRFLSGFLFSEYRERPSFVKTYTVCGLPYANSDHLEIKHYKHLNMAFGIFNYSNSLPGPSKSSTT